jgi:hypothetical protein
VSFQAQKVTQSMREEDSADSFFNKFFHWKLIDNSNLNQMLKNDFFSKQMHIIPLDTRLKHFQDFPLRLINRIINVFLFFSELATNRESNSLIGTISIPLSAHIVKSHISWLIYFVIVDVMESGAVLAA